MNIRRWGSTARVSRTCWAISSNASSQLISFQPGSIPMPRSGFVRRSGAVIRASSRKPSKPESPLAHVRPPLCGFSGSPRILSTTPSSLTCARIPQRLRQMMHEERTQPSPNADPDRSPKRVSTVTSDDLPAESPQRPPARSHDSRCTPLDSLAPSRTATVGSAGWEVVTQLVVPGRRPGTGAQPTWAGRESRTTSTTCQG